MITNDETPERLKLRRKLQQCQRTYAALLSQQKNTRGVFSGQQLAGGLAPSPSQIAKAKQNTDDAEANLKRYDQTHPISDQSG